MTREQSPKGNWATRFLRKHVLGESPFLHEDIEPVAIELLSNPLTAFEGAELVLKREVDPQEIEVAQIVDTPDLSAKEKYGFLLLQEVIEGFMEGTSGQS